MGSEMCIRDRQYTSHFELHLKQCDSCVYYVLDLKWALIVGLTVANIMDHKAQLQNMAIEEVFRHQMGGVGIIPLRMCCFDVVPVVW